MLPLSSLDSSRLEGLRMVVSDVDDTITTAGRLHPCALEAMYRLRECGLSLVLLTGGSAGWADVYIRQWPVDMVIAESGAVALRRDESGLVTYSRNSAIADDERLLRMRLIEWIGEARLSSDQYARLHDVALDKAKCTPAELEEIRGRALAAGASLAESSIHLNMWFGTYSKLQGLRFFTGMDDDRLREQSTYIGDSLPDQELFAFFPLSFGVHSVKMNRDAFAHLPTYYSPDAGGEGFSQIVDALVVGR